MLDIEFPLKTRSADATGPVIERLAPTVETAPDTREPFLVGLLLSAKGPFGLEVEVKSDGRVVGLWSIEVNPRDAGGAFVSQAKANLYVCASTLGDARATGAFLVIRQWWVNTSDKPLLDQLYASLSAAALERLDSLMGGVPNETGEPRSCVLFLLDGRRLERKSLSLDRLQAQLLLEIEGDHSIAGMDLRVAHGRGTGTAPTLSSTLPAAFPAADSVPGALAAEAPPARRSLVGEVFVRETVSPENVRWNRRASDKGVAMQRGADADPVPPALP
jgi:hypothetical protein